ncbi:MAG: 2-octaprenyl-6-methoxyphenyl hydroxylase [Gammaproteobacteria bacterium]|nr:2-octaprenyl-6-methoxyphenyl hydroxylase [Gammaproteobacteria bacterium]
MANKMSNNTKKSQYDLVIVGGGMVGASLACALGAQPLRIAMVEAVPYQAESQPSYDDRAIALSFGTHTIFNGIGVWPHLAEHATAIKHIHVSEQGAFGATRLHHSDEGVPALGYVVTARHIGQALISRLQTLKNVEVISPAQLSDLHHNEEFVSITVRKDNQSLVLESQLLIAADGGQSTTRQLLGISATKTDYRQSAIIANVSTQQPHGNVAFERFTPDGPLAVLPMSAAGDNHRCAVVWTQRGDKVEAIAALDEPDFLQQLQRSFGNRLGRFLKAGKRSVYPLYLMHVQEQVRPRVALIGNAAHTLHPIAGQGFNLGLRDVAALAEIIVNAQQAQADIGDLGVLQQYAQWRKTDHKQIIGFTDSLVRLFSNRFAPLHSARTAGLLALDTLPPVKHVLAKHTMGLAGKLPRLARGLSL